ncbi:outer membrane protein assembly factor BamD [Halopseudomonas salegens]|uniref:Uncharacterized protein n=1 Tax=Halopseudomonas salegens TaxID=1434072 RepID=A0A1H2FZ62_9GAMM|nr:hypothetical protein [Halopseudomonas salegens]SDU12623.1 hypothetical protein SAMN05216210_1914 [Halopseudomonas salegens]
MYKLMVSALLAALLTGCGSDAPDAPAGDTVLQGSGMLDMELLGHEDIANGDFTLAGKQYEVVVYREDFVPAGIWIDWDKPAFVGQVTATLEPQSEIRTVGEPIYRLVDIQKQ